MAEQKLLVPAVAEICGLVWSLTRRVIAFTYTGIQDLVRNFVYVLDTNGTMAANTSLPLKGKTALVTGSARGIGAAIAWKLATEGADVSDCSIEQTASGSGVS